MVIHLHSGFCVVFVVFGTYRGGPSRWDADSHRCIRSPAGDIITDVTEPLHKTCLHQSLHLHCAFQNPNTEVNVKMKKNKNKVHLFLTRSAFDILEHKTKVRLMRLSNI